MVPRQAGGDNRGTLSTEALIARRSAWDVELALGSPARVTASRSQMVLGDESRFMWKVSQTLQPVLTEVSIILIR